MSAALKVRLRQSLCDRTNRKQHLLTTLAGKHPPKPEEPQQRTAALLSVANYGTTALQDANSRCCLTLGLT
ncbi:hypothetical protein [Nostoc sp.]|uniref:hypothetical protein n=1 Tax=Nostoc sp. TaxID=1180 RepID=UPI002FF37F3B